MLNLLRTIKELYKSSQVYVLFSIVFKIFPFNVKKTYCWFRRLFSKIVIHMRKSIFCKISQKTSFFKRGNRKTDLDKIRCSAIFSSTWTGPAVPFSKRRTLFPMLMARSFLSSSWLVTDHRSDASVSICSWNRSQFASRSPCFSDRLKVTTWWRRTILFWLSFADFLPPFSKFLMVDISPSTSFHHPKKPTPGNPPTLQYPTK